MASWPSTLPAPKYGGYQLAPVDQTIRTDMEVGQARQRRRTTARNDKLTLAWTFTDAEMATFRAWFDDDIAGGNSWFGSLPIAIGNGVETTHECRFTGPWRGGLGGGMLWQISAEVEVR